MGEFPFEPGGVMLMATDGVHSSFTPDELEEVLSLNTIREIKEGMVEQMSTPGNMARWLAQRAPEEYPTIETAQAKLMDDDRSFIVIRRPL
jgi:serine/threonine protein phosphatase PrpC